MKTYRSKTSELAALRAFVRYETHGGYVWAAVTADGDLLCTPCVRSNYREVFRATRDYARYGWVVRDGWAVRGLANSGDSEETEYCAHCNRQIWEK